MSSRIARAVFIPLVMAGLVHAVPAQAEEPLVFSRDVQPIIADKCFACHGPDEQARKKGLRFDLQEGLFGTTKDGQAMIVPGKPGESAFYQRIIHADPDERMPPEEAVAQLTTRELRTLEQWIIEGAAWEGHWAFQAPTRPELPEVSNANWCRNPIDRFILSRLDGAGLKPSEEASKETLIRRVTLDLTGLPPTPEEVRAFLLDNSPNAYERVVDRLLASPRYGERMAFVWLDAARYSDTGGYQRDTKRTMWPWRDWVIAAFNENMPYDQFTIEQLAGDLLPDATLEQKIATGFNRNHRINGEGGIIPEEYAVEYVADRVITTGMAWMGLTMECARCHDHKFDPISQKEFYEFSAFFNNVPEKGKGDERGNDRPFIKVPSADESRIIDEMKTQIAAATDALMAPDTELDALQAMWEEEMGSLFSQVTWNSVTPTSVESAAGATLTIRDDGTILASGENPDKDTYTVTFTAPGPLGAIKLDVLTDDSLPNKGPGRSENGNVVISGIQVEHVADGTTPVPVVDALADYSQPKGDYRVGNAINAEGATGWALGAHLRRENRQAVFVLDANAIKAGDTVRVRVLQQSQYRQHTVGKFRLAVSEASGMGAWARPTLEPWQYLGLLKERKPARTILDEALAPEEGYDPDREYKRGLKWEPKPEWNDGVLTPFESKLPGAHYLYRKFTLAAPTRLTFSLGSDDAMKVWVDGIVKLSKNVDRGVEADQDMVPVFLAAGEHEIMIKVVNYGGSAGFYFRVVEDDGAALLGLLAQFSGTAAERTPEQRRQLRALYREQNPDWQARRASRDDLKAKLADIERKVVTTMVMEEMETPRDTYLLVRGAYDKPDTSAVLKPSVPAALGEMDDSLPKNRLGFAQWLMEPSHPLTARVRVNHYWQQYFGNGIVKTSEDFGTQGAPPTHPKLLDWLAVEFVESGWDVKAMQKLIVMSATYRQSSAVTEELLERDPRNLLLARAPRFRLRAEMIRDQALKLSGLLNGEIGGPSVFPYQPPAMWSSLTFQNMDEFSTNFYTHDTGDKVYRRGLYTFWKRTILPPRMQIFNAAGREQCSMRTETTNTPLQAMVLMNDPTFVEAARHLGQRMILEGGDNAMARVRYGYTLTLGRAPDGDRQRILEEGIADYQAHFASNPEAAKEFITIGESEPHSDIEATELAAYAMLGSVLLNLDETITRE